MFTILLDTQLTASHQLAFSDAPQEPLHEHDWKVFASVSAPELDKDGMVMDFEVLKQTLETILQDFQHQRLEALAPFQNCNASAENLAKVLYEQLASQLPDTVHLDYIEVTEAPHCRARYSRSHN